MHPVTFLVRQFRHAPSKRLFFRSLALGSNGGNAVVTSAEGTKISMRKTGQGTPVVLVHGVLDGMGAWSFVEPYLAEGHSVTVYDRRGRGESDPGHDGYGIAREVADLAAVIETTDKAPHVIAHSMGGVIAMLAHLDGVPMRSLVLYEPPINGLEIDLGTLDEIRRLVDADQLDDAIRLMAVKLAGVSEDQLATALGIPPVRKALRDGVRVAPRELAALRRVTWSGLPIEGTPTLVISGADTDVRVYPQPDQIGTIASNVESRKLTGQGHLGHTYDAPQFLRIVQQYIQTV